MLRHTTLPPCWMAFGGALFAIYDDAVPVLQYLASLLPLELALFLLLSALMLLLRPRNGLLLTGNSSDETQQHARHKQPTLSDM